MGKGVMENVKPTDSLKKRYFAKLAANLFGLAIGVVTQAIIPRGLGPEAYGNFSFLSNFFSRIVGFLDMGTSIGFYTKLSQRQRDFGLVSFYLSFTGIASFLLIIFVECIHVTGAYATLLPDQIPFYIYLAAVWGNLSWLVKILNKMADAYGVTVSTEIAKIVQKGLGLVLILTLFLMNQVTLTHFFFYHYFILIFLALAFILVMGRSGHSLRRSWRLSVVQIKAYAKEFYNYSHPLFVYALIGLIVGILDRWLLQYFSGSVEQGFYGLSYRIGAICFLFTGAITPLITREFAIAFDKKNIPEMARLFRRYIPMLYAIAAYFACFIALQADKVTFIMGGANFQQAALSVTIMAFYPIYQTYGQLGGSVFFATGQTALYRNIGVVFLFIGLPVTYFLIAPKELWGINAGATGLAIKMVVLAFMGVNVQLWFNARLLNLSFWKLIGHQFYSVGFMISLAWLATAGTDMFIKNIVLAFLVSGFIYTLGCFVLLILAPFVFSVSHPELINGFQKLRLSLLKNRGR